MTGPLGNSPFCFPRISMFPSAAPRGNIEILGKQNELFPSGPVIKCLMLPLSWRNLTSLCALADIFVRHQCFHLRILELL